MIPLLSRETSRCLRRAWSLALAISLGWWNVPAVLTAQENLVIQPSYVPADSLALGALELEIRQAEFDLIQTNLFHRLVPQIHFSASIGIREVFFIDPSNMLFSYLPKDAYRLSITLPITEIFDGSRHRIAELRLDHLRAELTRLRLQSQRVRAELHRELASLEVVAGIDSVALSMKEDVLRFEELRFSHGKIEYDDLVRSRLEVLNAKRYLSQLEHRINEIRLKFRPEP